VGHELYTHVNHHLPTCCMPVLHRYPRLNQVFFFILSPCPVPVSYVESNQPGQRRRKLGRLATGGGSSSTGRRPATELPRRPTAEQDQRSAARAREANDRRRHDLGGPRRRDLEGPRRSDLRGLRQTGGGSSLTGRDASLGGQPTAARAGKRAEAGLLRAEGC
jgi:hypothetical protein